MGKAARFMPTNDAQSLLALNLHPIRQRRTPVFNNTRAHLGALPYTQRLQMNTCLELPSGANLRRLLACTVACFIIDATAGGPASANLPAASPAALYLSYCSVCHGEQGNGQSRARASLNPPPSDFTHPARANLPRELMIATVREGRAGTAMVGWKTQLSDTQIAQVVDYVRTAFMKSAAPPQPTSTKTTSALTSLAAPVGIEANRPHSPIPLKGDKIAGGLLYENNCTACHGTAGDGNGPRAYFISPKPRSFITAESRAAFTRPLLIHSIAQGKRGTEMPSWEKVLTDQQIANLAEYVFQRFIATEQSANARTAK